MKYLQLMNSFLGMYEGIYVAVAIVLAVLLCDRLIHFKMNSSGKKHLFFHILEDIRYSVLVLVCISGILLFLRSIAVPAEFWSLVVIIEVALIVFTALIFLRMIKTAENYYLSIEESCSFSVNVFSTIARIILFLIVGMMILEKLGVNIGGILALGGIGGIAIGLASKDLLSNFFGFVTIVLDRPFKIGDLIYSSDRDIRGVVDRITWRFTRVITLEKKPMYIPNSIFSTIVIQNESNVLARRIDEMLKFEFREHSEITQFTQNIASLLENSDVLNQNFKPTFDVSKIGTGVIDIRFIAYTKARTWIDFSLSRQQILLAIFAAAKEVGLKIMYPETQICLYENR